MSECMRVREVVGEMGRGMARVDIAIEVERVLT